MNNNINRNCKICGKKVTILCYRCNLVGYCSTICQLKDWNRHKLFCIEKNNSSNGPLNMKINEKNINNINDSNNSQFNFKNIDQSNSLVEQKYKVKKRVSNKKKNERKSIEKNTKVENFNFLRQVVKTISDWITANETIVKFLWLLVLSWPLYRFFRHNPRIPDMRFSEFFVSMVYITNMKTIIDIIGGFFMPDNSTISMMAFVLCIVPLKQLTGYSYKRTLWKVIGGMSLLVIMALILAIIVAAFGYLAYIMMDWK